jgi:predicted nucleic acid-binding protein
MPVVDASILVTVLAEAEHADWAKAQLSGSGSTRRSLWAPHLIDAEVGHSLRRWVAARRLPAEHASAALGDLARLPLRRIPHLDLLDRAWDMRHNLSFYDGLYVALAERLDTPLMTLDNRLVRAAHTAAEVTVLTA